MTDDKGRQVAVIIGERIRALREAKSLRQEDVVTAARSVGLPWARSSVAALEAGSRALSIGEFLLIPALVAQLGGWEEPLLSPTDRIIVSDSLSLAAERLPGAMIGYLTPIGDTKTTLRQTGDTEELGSIPRADGEGHRGNQSQARIVVYFRVLYALKPDVDIREWRDMIGLDYEITRTVAGRLTSPRDGKGVSPFLVRAFAMALYGRSLGAERDARAESRGPYASKRALQSARGHATREIIDELQSAIDSRWSEIEPVFKRLDDVIDKPDELAEWLEEDPSGRGRY